MIGKAAVRSGSIRLGLPILEDFRAAEMKERHVHLLKFEKTYSFIWEGESSVNQLDINWKVVLAETVRQVNFKIID